MNYSLLKDLITHLEAYESQNGTVATLPNFVGYLTTAVDQPTEPVAAKKELPPDVHLAEGIAHLYRFAKTYTKIALEDSPLTTVDDFTFLANILRHGSCTKSELIERNIHEKTTGMEIIKRLLKNGFLHQTDDPNDGRSKRLSITPAGKEIFQAAAGPMYKAAFLVGGNLTTFEKKQLLGLVAKLKGFHLPLFPPRNTSLDEMLETIEATSPTH